MRCPICDWPHGAEEPAGWVPDGGLIVSVGGEKVDLCLNCAAFLTAKINEALFERGANMDLCSSRKLAVVLAGDVLDRLDREALGR